MKQLYMKSILLAGCLQIAAVSFCQDIHFSQFFEAPLYRNPALAGIVDGDIRVQTVYRSQWNSLANAYKTVSVNAEYKMPASGDDYVTVAMQVFNDKAGSTNLTTTHLLPAINYHKSLSDVKSTYLSVGFMGGYVQRSVDRSKITTNSTYNGQGDGEDGLVPQYGYFDASAGVSFNTQLGDSRENNLVLGAALHHLTKPKASFYNNPSVAIARKWVFSGDVKFRLTDYSFVTVHNDYLKQGSYTEALSGAVFTQKIGPYSEEPDFTIGAGGFLRWGDAFIPVVQLNYHPFALSMSYDVNVSALSSSSYGHGGYEMSLTYIGFLDRDNSSAKAVLCPRF